MKPTILLLTFTFFAIQLHAQTFAPIGAKWVYCYAVNAEGGTPGLGSLIAESVNETQFNNLPCKTLNIVHCPPSSFGCGLVSEFTVCQDGQRIFYRETDSLHLLYNFAAVPGDTLTLRYPVLIDLFNADAVASGSPTHFDIVITDTATVILQGQSIRSQSYELVETTGFYQTSWRSGQFLEGIGNTSGWLLPRSIAVIQETEIPYGLMRYEFPGDAPLFISTPCATSKTSDPAAAYDVQISPNPANDWLQVQLSSPALQTLSFIITDRLGRGLAQTAIAKGEESVNCFVEHLPADLYIWNFRTEKGEILSSGKVVVIR